MAKQLKRANGRIDIREMHTNAANEVTKMTEQQTPELRDTLSKQLLLPGRKKHLSYQGLISGPILKAREQIQLQSRASMQLLSASDIPRALGGSKRQINTSADPLIPDIELTSAEPVIPDIEVKYCQFLCKLIFYSGVLFWSFVTIQSLICS